MSAVDELLIANILLVPSFSWLASHLEAALCYIRGRTPPAGGQRGGSVQCVTLSNVKLDSPSECIFSSRKLRTLSLKENCFIKRHRSNGIRRQ